MAGDKELGLFISKNRGGQKNPARPPLKVTAPEGVFWDTIITLPHS